MPRRLPDAMSWHISGASDPARRARQTRPQTEVSASPSRPAGPRRPAAPARPVDARRALMARRRRVLLVLLSLVVLSLLLVAAGALPWALNALVDGLLVAYLWHLRVEAKTSARSRARRVPAPMRQPVGTPDQTPTRQAEPQVPADTPSAPVVDEPVTAIAEWDEPAEATGTGGWQPVPVPPPTYTLKPAAPSIVDLTRPGAWSDALLDDDPVLDPGEWDDDDLDAIVERRRAVGD